MNDLSPDRVENDFSSRSPNKNPFLSTHASFIEISCVVFILQRAIGVGNQ